MNLKHAFTPIDVDQFLGSIKAVLGSLLERYTSTKIIDKLGSSILATIFRQLVMHTYLINFLSPSCTSVEIAVKRCDVCFAPDR